MRTRSLRYTHRARLAVAAGLVVALGLAGCADGRSGKGGSDTDAAAYPTHTVTLVVFSSAGSGLDLGVRQLAETLTKQTGQTWTVENVDAGAGNAAATYQQNRPADGYTLGAWAASLVTKTTTGEMPYTLDQFDPIMRLDVQPFYWFVREDSPYQTMKQVIDAMRARPGKVTVAGPNPGSALHVGAMKLTRAANVEFAWVPFPGSAEVTTAVLGGHVDVGYGAAREEGLRALAVASSRRTELHPDAPTLSELGYPVEDYGWRGVLSKSGLDPVLRQRIADLIGAAATASSYQELVARNKDEYLPLVGDEFSAWLKTEQESNRVVLKDLGIEAR